MNGATWLPGEHVHIRECPKCGKSLSRADLMGMDGGAMWCAPCTLSELSGDDQLSFWGCEDEE